MQRRPPTSASRSPSWYRRSAFHWVGLVGALGRPTPWDLAPLPPKDRRSEPCQTKVVCASKPEKLSRASSSLVPLIGRGVAQVSALNSTSTYGASRPGSSSGGPQCRAALWQSPGQCPVAVDGSPSRRQSTRPWTWSRCIPNQSRDALRTELLSLGQCSSEIDCVVLHRCQVTRRSDVAR